MARQQRLPFDWQSRKSENAEQTPSIRPLSGDDFSEETAPAMVAESQPSRPDETGREEPPDGLDDLAVEAAEEGIRSDEPDDSEEGGGQENYADDVPMSLGQVLVDARAAVGLSIADVADRTKVPPQFVEAAENEAFKEFPARLYARGHLLKLCAAYKIAGQPVLDLFQAAAGSEEHAVNQSGDQAKHYGAAKGNVDFSRYAPALQTQKSATGAGHRLTVTMVSIGLGLIVGVVVITFILTQIRNTRLNKQNDSLGVDSNSAADLTIEEFIQEVPLPLKKLPVPGDSPGR